ncbi:MAG: VanZ family protein [Nitrospirales bacterium]
MIERVVQGPTGQGSNQRYLASRFMVPGLALALLGCIALLWIPVPSPTILLKAFYDFCHFPLFGGVAIILLYLARQLGEPRGWSVGSQYGMACIGAVVLGALTEGMQSFSSSRFAEWSDLCRDVSGAVAALGLYVTYDARFTGRVAVWRLSPRKQLVHAVVGLLVVIALSPVLVWTYAYWDRAARFPSLVEFSSAWEMMFVKERDCAVQIVPPPLGWGKPRVDTVGHVVCYPARYPGIRLEEPYPDWRGFSRFRVEVYSELPVARSLIIRIDDAHHNHEYADRFNQEVIISPGLNHIHILLDDIRHAPLGRELDLGAIRNVMFFAISPPEEFSLYVDNIRLE